MMKLFMSCKWTPMPNEQLVEAVETNFVGSLDEAKVEETDPCRKFKLKKIEKERIKEENQNFSTFHFKSRTLMNQKRLLKAGNSNTTWHLEMQNMVLSTLESES